MPYYYNRRVAIVSKCLSGRSEASKRCLSFSGIIRENIDINKVIDK